MLLGFPKIDSSVLSITQPGMVFFFFFFSFNLDLGSIWFVGVIKNNSKEFGSFLDTMIVCVVGVFMFQTLKLCLCPTLVRD